MSPEKTKELVDTFPALFVNDPQKCISLFGFECGDGWFGLLKECIEKIKVVCESQQIEIHVAQIKEKWGTLRFYIDYGTDEIFSIINEAEQKSEETCEHCGQPGSMRKYAGRFYSIHCDKCFEESNARIVAKQPSNM